MLHLGMSRRWRSMKAVWILFAVELVFTVPALALFAIAQPNLYRTKLWQFGYENHLNSNPVNPIYAMVNRVPYSTPVVWRQFLTDFNVVISVLSLFIMLAKVVMFVMHIFWPIIGVATHGLLVALWGYSVYAQTCPDNSDSRVPALSAPWYIVKGCGIVTDKQLYGYCQQAQASLGVSVVMLALFAANTALAIWSAVPSRAERLARRTTLESTDTAMQMKFDPPPTSAKQRAWSIKENYAPNTPGAAPFTPRTMAFNRLGGGGTGKSDLPLRHS